MLYSSSELFGQLPLLETGKKRELGRMRSPFLGRFDDGEHRLVGVNSDANADSGAFAIAVTADSSDSSSRRGRTHPCVGRSTLSVQLQLLYSRCWHLTESVASTSHFPFSGQWTSSRPTSSASFSVDWKSETSLYEHVLPCPHWEISYHVSTDHEGVPMADLRAAVVMNERGS